MSAPELSRELIALSRQGGASLQDLRDQRRARGDEQREAREAKAEAERKQSKAGSRSGSSSGMRRSSTAPSLTGGGRGAAAAGGPRAAAGGLGRAGGRRGGGWAYQGKDPLGKFKEMLASVAERRLDLDYCERPLFRTALWEAAWKNNEAIVRLLAAKGAKVDAADYEGRTPLHEAAFYGHTGLVEFLLDKGHPLDPVDVFEQTPLFRAVAASRFDIVELLVRRGAQTNRVDQDGLTVQHLAAFGGREAFANYLYCHGAVKDRFGFESANFRQPLLLRSTAAAPPAKGKAGGAALVGEGALVAASARHGTRSAAVLPLGVL